LKSERRSLRINSVPFRRKFLVKKYKYLLSALLVPAMILQAGGRGGHGGKTGGGGTTGTCTSGGSGSTAVTLPGSVTGVQKFDYTASTLYTFSVTSVSSPGAISVGTYGAWCTDPNHLTIPGGGTTPVQGQPNIVTPAEDKANPTGSAVYTPVNSSTINGAGGGSYGEPGFTWDATIMNSNGTLGAFTSTPLTLAQEWAAVNWIINHPTGTGDLPPTITTTDTQAAIWQLLHPEMGYGFVVTAPATPTSDLTGNSWLLYKEALASGLSYTPGTGDLIAILMVPSSKHPSYQGFLIPVRLACTSTGSATLTKTSNVSSAGANAFQLVTYTYTIKNTGSTTLQNLVIVDDNGTPDYTGDDVTITLPTGTTLAPGASYSVTSQVYLPISLFYQTGSAASFDTLIPQVVPVPTGSAKGTLPSLLLTYLIDSDVTDNTYGTGASAGWAGNGGHTIAEVEAGYAEFAFYNSKGTLVSDFNADYLSNVGVTPSVPSGLNAGLMGNPSVGGSTYISYIGSTLSEHLNYYPQFVGNTVNSPVAGTAAWETTAGYKVLVNQGLFGVYGMGSAVIKKNYLAATETAFGGKCGSAHAATYTPTICGNLVSSTAYLCANVCGCTTVVHAKACLTVKLCGTIPTCGSASAHQCQNPVHCSCTCANCKAGNHGQCTAKVKCTAPVCGCTCAQCRAGNHASCTHVGCTDSTCHANNCNHNTVQCVIASKPATLCW
jgi:hypothetical protein